MLTAHDLIEEARFKAYLDTLKPKARLRYLKAVSDIIGDPAVVPLLPVQRVKVIQEAREMWARIVPNLISAAGR